MIESSLLAPWQRKLIAWTLVFLSITLILALGLSVLHYAKEFLHYFSNVLWPIVISGILALLIRPMVLWIKSTLSISHNQSVFAVFIFLLGIFGLFIWVVVPQLVNQTDRFVENIPQIFENGSTFLKEKFPEYKRFFSRYWEENSDQGIPEFLQNMGTLAWSTAGNIGENFLSLSSSFLAIIAALAIIPMYVFYFLENRRNFIRDLEKQFSFIPKKFLKNILFLINEFVQILVDFFRGQLLIGLIMGFLLAIGFSLIGLEFGFMVGLLLGLANMVPYLGIVLSVVTVFPIAFFQPNGGFPILGLSVLVLILVQMIEGYLLTPRIMGKKTGLHPMVILVSVFFWGTALDGILGMVLAIPLTAIFITAWRLIKSSLPNSISLH